MEEIIGYKIESFPFEGMEHISNLIEFEGPLLAHYKDKYDSHFLYYWVDNDENYNRWLVWKVSEQRLYLYLQKLITLEDLFPIKSDNIFCVDIDSKIVYTNIWITYPDAISENYRPEPFSFYHFNPPAIYEKKLQVGTYLETLKENALYFNVEPAYDRYGVTVSVQDVFNVLENLTKSISEYVKYRVKNILTKRITDLNRIRIATESLSSQNRLRVCYLNLNSFHVGIAADNLNIEHNAMDSSIEDFQNEVLQTYKNEVLDNDFSSAEDVNILIDKFPDEESRKKIFDPLVKIINNENIQVNITDYTKKFDKKYKRVSNIDKSVLLPARPTKQNELDHPNQALIVAYVVADKNDKQQTLFPKDVTKRILFKRETSTFPFEFDRIRLLNGNEIYLNRVIEVEVKFEGGHFILEFETLGILVSVNDKDKLEEKFNSELVTLYTRYIEQKDLRFAKFFEAELKK